MITLDAIQSRAVSASVAHRDAGHDSGLTVMPTGTGKLRTATKVSREFIGTGRWGLFVAHTDELVDQAVKGFRSQGLPCLVEKAEQKAMRDAIQCRGGVSFVDPDTRIVVAGKDTLQGKRLAAWPRDFFDHIHFDEAHRSTSTTWRQVRDHFAPAYCQGWTATPDRADKVSLASVYRPSPHHPRGYVYEYLLWDAVANRHLVPLEERICQSRINLRDIRVNKTDGDFNKGDLEDRINASLKVLANAIVDEIEKVGIEYFILFAPGVLVAEAFALAMTKLGVPSKFVHGQHPDRTTIMQGFQRREFRGLCNADVLIEGVDVPHCQASVIARPTKSRGRFAQMVGRTTRLCSYIEKPIGYIIQPAWIGADLKLASTVDLFAKPGVSPAVKERAKKLVADGDLDNPMTALDVAEEIEDRKKAREVEADRRRVRVDIHRKRVDCKVIVRDPVLRAMGSASIKSTPDAHAPIEPYQVSSLAMFGVPGDVASGLTKGEAEAMRRSLQDRERKGLANYGQVKRLVREAGLAEVTAASMSARSASDWLHTCSRPDVRAC